MTSSLERDTDGSLRLFINGDLQFDSNDERIYHESLALPALVVATGRIDAGLKVLIIGGGDGLVARELFKSSTIASLDLVDYDPEILSFAQTEFKALNESSLSDARVAIHVKDAWQFVEESLVKGEKFDLIVSDLTVPEDLAGARFHTIDWYRMLTSLLGEKGVLSVNAVSPNATPEAFWSVFNSMVKGGLHTRPYHVNIPSFAALGYGTDWGFMLASPRTIEIGELEGAIEQIQPRQYLKDTNHLRALFEFPVEVMNVQPAALPALLGSDILLHYFYNSSGPLTAVGDLCSSFSLSTNSLSVPEAATGKEVLPPELVVVLASSISSELNETSADAQGFLYGVLELMPSLRRDHTQKIIEDFIQNPALFLESIDLKALVARLLKRAFELPKQLVEELELLRDKLTEWAGDHMSLLSLGRRVVTILMLVVVIGNLLYPDMVYGKGHAGAHEAGHEARGDRGRGDHRGDRNRPGWREGYYWDGGTWIQDPTYQKRIIRDQTNYIQERVPRGPEIKNYGRPRGGGVGEPSSMLPMPGSPDADEYFDENGTLYPVRRYRIEAGILPDSKLSATSAGECSAVYRLGPGADILASGHMVLPVTDQAYLLITPEAMHVVDRQSGRSVMALANETSLTDLLRGELAEQIEHQSVGAKTAAMYLAAAHDLVQTVEINREDQAPPIIPGGQEIFPNVWISSDGERVAFNRVGSGVTYLNRDDSTASTGSNANDLTTFKAVVTSYLAKQVRDAESTNNKLLKDKQELNAYIDVLSKELNAYVSSSAEMVEFGSHTIDRAEAIRRTQLALSRSQEKTVQIERYIKQLPRQNDALRVALRKLAPDYEA